MWEVKKKIRISVHGTSNPAIMQLKLWSLNTNLLTNLNS